MFNPHFGAGVILAATIAVASLSGCNRLLPKPAPVIAVPDESVPHQVKTGEPAPLDGWLLPTPLFNELMPCMRDVLENADPVPDDGWQPNILPQN